MTVIYFFLNRAHTGQKPFKPVAGTSRTSPMPPKQPKGKAIRKPVPQVEPSSSDDTEDEEHLTVSGSSRSVNCHTSSSDNSDVDTEHLIQQILASAFATKITSEKPTKPRPKVKL